MPAPSREGEIIDAKYRIGRKIGEGGMGAVYVGENTRVKKTVAIKFLHAAAGTAGDIISRFEREAQVGGQVANPHIVEVYDLGTTSAGERFMVMEYLEGESLRSRQKRMKRLSVEQVIDWSTQLLEGLAAAHRQGIIHRDLKPDNVFLVKSRDGRADFVKILDFGISKFTQDTEGSMTQTGTLLGSPNYMSPEHVRDSTTVDARSDLYAVGVMLFESLTGTLPRKAPALAELLFKIAYEPVPDPRSLVPSIPAWLAQLILRATSADPAARFGDADEMRAAMSRRASEPLLGGPVEGEFATLSLPPGAGALDGADATLALDPNELGRRTPGPASSTGALAHGGPPSFGSQAWPGGAGSAPGPLGQALQNPPGLSANGGPGASTLPASEPAFSASQPAFSASQPAFSASQPAFSASQPAFSASQPAFSASQPAFSASQPAFSPGPPGAFGPGHASSSQPSFSSSHPSFSSSQAGHATAPGLSTSIIAGGAPPDPGMLTPRERRRGRTWVTAMALAIAAMMGILMALVMVLVFDDGRAPASNASATSASRADSPSVAPSPSAAVSVVSSAPSAEPSASASAASTGLAAPAAVKSGWPGAGTVPKYVPRKNPGTVDPGY